MPVVTISREIGSRGTVIGERVARRLGYRLVDKYVMAQVLEEYGLIDFDRVYEAAQGFWDRFDRRTHETVTMLNKLIRALAQHGNVVIIGRGSFAVLGGLADVLNVRVQAPIAYRAQQIMAQEPVQDHTTAESMIRERDRSRAEFVEMTYRVRLDAAHPFDLVLNTGKINPEIAANWIVDIVQQLPYQHAADAPTTASLTVDPILANFLAEKYFSAPHRAP